MFDEAGPGNCSGCIFSGKYALTIALNVATRFPPTSTTGAPATAARDWDNQLVETSGPAAGPTPPLPITLLVNKDANCAVPTSPPFVEPGAGNANKNTDLEYRRWWVTRGSKESSTLRLTTWTSMVGRLATGGLGRSSPGR